VTTQQTSAHVDQFREWAKAAHNTALTNHTRGDAFGKRLANTRAEVYQHAASIAEQQHPECAARTLTDLVREHLTRDIVRIGSQKQIDSACLSYIKARAYQLCAQTLEPSTPEIQPKWN
jgi:hypothetical protein